MGLSAIIVLSILSGEVAIAASLLSAHMSKLRSIQEKLITTINKIQEKVSFLELRAVRAEYAPGVVAGAFFRRHMTVGGPGAQRNK